MKHLVNSLFFLGCIQAFSLGCSPRHDRVDEANFLQKTQFSFEEIKNEILEPHCISCHENRHRAFANYSLVKAASKQILSRVETQNQSRLMPPKGPRLPGELIAKLRSWVQAGAPLKATLDTELVEKKPAIIEFSFVKENVLKPKCIGCHSHFNDYKIVKEKLVSIYSFILDGTMPFPRKKNQPAEKLSLVQMETLENWINQGAPYTVELPQPELKEEVLKPTWLSLRNKVLGPKCILCHNSFGSRAPTSMSTYLELQNWLSESPQLFNKKDPEKSFFVGAILGRVDEEVEEFFYDPMPFNSPTDDVPTDIDSVTSEELEVIKEWIRLGLPYSEEDLS